MTRTGIAHGRSASGFGTGSRSTLVPAGDDGASERVAVVIGAGGGLGRATAESLATAGYMVVGVDRNEEGLKELSDGIRRKAGDATDPAAAKSLIDQIAAEVGPP